MNHTPAQQASVSNQAISDSASKAEFRVKLKKKLKESLESRDRYGGRSASELQVTRALENYLSNLPGIWLAYRGSASEVHLTVLDSANFASKGIVQFAYPVVGEKDSMRFYRAVRSSAAFSVGSFGIEAPALDGDDWTLVDADTDVAVRGALVPGLGFDRSGTRLGRGGGFYDRFLSETDSRRRAKGYKPLIKIGIGFHEQVVEELPCESHDVKLDAVLTDREWITPVKGAENE